MWFEGMPTAISVENLSKKYLLRHESGQQPYVALRDVLSDGVRNIGRRLLGCGTATAVSAKEEEFWALKDVSFEVSQGERIGIIGRNGAGKSTLLKILSRITEPTKGMVRIRGRVASLLEVGTGFHPELTGRENIYLNGAILGMAKEEIRRNFDEIVSFAEIEKFLDTPVKRYSSGMYVRLAFAVAAHLDPDILVVDEVLAVGDAQFQDKCLGKMAEAGRSGRTVLFVSHNMAAISQLCYRAVLLSGGEVRCCGPVETVVEHYLAQGRECFGERHWNESERPGNSMIRLHVARLRKSNGLVSNNIAVDEDFWVELEYEVLASHGGMRTGFWVYTATGVLVFVAGDNVAHGWKSKKRQPGHYKSRCLIPARLLNSGNYYLTVAADIQGGDMLFLENSVLQFTIEHTGVSELDGAGRSNGIICPTLEWQIDQVQEVNVGT